MCQISTVPIDKACISPYVNSPHFSNTWWNIFKNWTTASFSGRTIKKTMTVPEISCVSVSPFIVLEFNSMVSLWLDNHGIWVPTVERDLVIYYDNNYSPLFKPTLIFDGNPHSSKGTLNVFFFIHYSLKFCKMVYYVYFPCISLIF